MPRHPGGLCPQAFGDRGDHFGRHAVVRVVVIDHEQSRRTACLRNQASSVQRDKRPEIDNARGDSLLLEPAGRLERFLDEIPDRDHRHLRAVTQAAQTPEAARLDLSVRGHRIVEYKLAHAVLVEQLVLEEHHRIVIADRRYEEALEVTVRSGIDDLEAGDMREGRRENLRMLRRRADAAHRGAEHQREPHAAP
jgi:hypothetical protein